ncbi:hypothetical protein IFM89_039129, partial [Coptis chinensis]
MLFTYLSYLGLHYTSLCILWVEATLYCMEIRFKGVIEKGNGRSGRETRDTTRENSKHLALPITFGDRQVYIEEKRTSTRGYRFYEGKNKKAKRIASQFDESCSPKASRQ